MELITGTLMLIAGLSIYFMPAVLASQRNVKQKLGVFFLNLFLGWTFLFWVASFVWAVSGEVDEQRI
jgi:hypothetical protein